MPTKDLVDNLRVKLQWGMLVKSVFQTSTISFQKLRAEFQAQAQEIYKLLPSLFPSAPSFQSQLERGHL